MEARMCFEFQHGLADIRKFYPSLLVRDKIYTNIRQSMLKLPTHSGFHDLFLKYPFTCSTIKTNKTEIGPLQIQM